MTCACGCGRTPAVRRTKGNPRIYATSQCRRRVECKKQRAATRLGTVGNLGSTARTVADATEIPISLLASKAAVSDLCLIALCMRVRRLERTL